MLILAQENSAFIHITTKCAPEKKRVREAGEYSLCTSLTLLSGKQFPVGKDELLCNRVVQFFARRETHTLLGRNLNLRASLWVDAGASSSGLHSEGAKANQANLFTRLQGIADRIQGCVDQIGGFLHALA